MDSDRFWYLARYMASDSQRPFPCLIHDCIYITSGYSLQLYPLVSLVSCRFCNMPQQQRPAFLRTRLWLCSPRNKCVIQYGIEDIRSIAYVVLTPTSPQAGPLASEPANFAQCKWNTSSDLWWQDRTLLRQLKSVLFGEYWSYISTKHFRIQFQQILVDMEQHELTYPIASLYISGNARRGAAK